MKIENFLTPTNISTNKLEQNTDTFKSVLEKAGSKQDLAGLEKATKEFESYFVHKLLSTMRKSVSQDRSNVRMQYEDMLDQEYAKKITESGGIGISKFLYDQLKKTYTE